MGKVQRQPSPAKLAAPTAVWVWKAFSFKAKPIQPPRKLKPVLGAEVGVGEDWSHLSKRRQRSRVGKLRRERTKMVVLKNIARRRWKNQKLREANEQSGLESTVTPQSAAIPTQVGDLFKSRQGNVSLTLSSSKAL